MRARHRRPVMYFSGLNAHLRYVTVAVLDRLGGVALETTVPTREPDRLLAVLAPFRPLAVVVETCPLLALALRFARAGRDRLSPRPRQGAAGDRDGAAEKRCGGRAAPRPHAPLRTDPGGVPAVR